MKPTEHISCVPAAAPNAPCASAASHATGAPHAPRAAHAPLARFALFALLGATLAFFGLGLGGCAANTATDDTGGISSAADEDAAAINAVNTSQLPDSSFLYDTQIADLQDSSLFLDGQTVQVTGEVVGDRIVSDYSSDFFWITLQATDGSYAEVSVYMPASSTEMIDMYGSYGKRGTILQVRGTFYAARAEHDGVSELEAQNVSVVKKGEVAETEVKPERFITGFVLLAIGGGLALLYRYLGERRR